MNKYVITTSPKSAACWNGSGIVARRGFLTMLAGLTVLPVVGPYELLTGRPRKYVQGADLSKRFIRVSVRGHEFFVVGHSGDGKSWSEIPAPQLQV